MNKKKVIALFDFDGTITWNDTLLTFLIYTHGCIKTCFLLFLELPYLLGFLVKVISRQRAKERILSRFFKGESIDNLSLMGNSFAESRLEKCIRPEAKKRIEWHLSQNHRCILISASIESYLIPWAKKAGFDAALTSQLESDHFGRFTGKLKGKNCWGQEKLDRVKEYIPYLEDFIIYVYGDSRGDKEILEIADYAFFRKLS